MSSWGREAQSWREFRVEEEVRKARMGAWILKTYQVLVILKGPGGQHFANKHQG